MGKEEGRVTGLWPGTYHHHRSHLFPYNGDIAGSCLHAVRALESPRWEDFKYEFLDGNKNRFHWLGDGCTYNEKHMVGDRESIHRLIAEDLALIEAWTQARGT
jgi:hypothetical protein